MTDGEKERIKLRATWLNGISIATFAVGTLTSTVRLLLDDAVAFRTGAALICLAVGCLALSYALHFAAQVVLKGLDR